MNYKEFGEKSVLWLKEMVKEDVEIKEKWEGYDKETITGPTGIVLQASEEVYRMQVELLMPQLFQEYRMHGWGGTARLMRKALKTGSLLKEYISRQRNSALLNQPLIVNRTGRKLSRDGVQYIIDKYVHEIYAENTAFPDHVHCHQFRHSKAMHMLAAGINIVYIRDFLGHEDISTTQIYIRADNRLKNEAINALAPKIAEETSLPDWRTDQDLLGFLNSFR